MNFLRGCLAMFLLVGLSGTASGATPVAEVVATQVLATDSLRAHTFSLLSRGQVTEAIDYWVLTTGKDAPAWLLAARASFDASKQVAGACQGVRPEHPRRLHPVGRQARVRATDDPLPERIRVHHDQTGERQGREYQPYGLPRAGPDAGPRL